MTLKKKLIMLVVLVLSLTLCCFGLVACVGNNDVPPNSGEEAIDWSLVYTVSEDGSTITGLTEYGKTLSKIVIPKTLNEKAITSIGDEAFKNCESLMSVTIGSGIKSIGDNAFLFCSNLNKVNYTGTVDQWVQISFYDCDSNPIYHAHNLYINDVLLTESNITTATKVSSYAFYNCHSLSSVTIGSGVTKIGDWAFTGCYKLVEVINKSSLNITKGIPYNGDVGSYALNVKKSGKSEIVNQNGYLFYAYEGTNYLLGYKGKATSLTLPDKYNGENYEIYQYAFGNCRSLTSIVIPNNITSMGIYAFGGCVSLTSVTIGSGVKSIGSDAFNGCSVLTSMVIPNSVTRIGMRVFSYCSSLASVTFENTEGWFVDKNWDATSGTDVIVTDAAQNVTYLTDTYRSYHWKRK